MSSCIVVMAKAPVAGYAKTRLIPALGAEGAARLAEQLLRHALSEATHASADHVVLCAAPDHTHPSFTSLQADLGVELTDQSLGDLGERMHHAFLQALRQHEQVLLMGTDAPALSARVLREALALLGPEEADAVFVPAFDGGYALVGLRHPCEALFAEMPWSTPQVMALTRARALTAGLRIAELPAVADIDEPQDLRHLPADWIATGNRTNNTLVQTTS